MAKWSVCPVDVLPDICRALQICGSLHKCCLGQINSLLVGRSGEPDAVSVKSIVTQEEKKDRFEEKRKQDAGAGETKT